MSYIYMYVWSCWPVDPSDSGVCVCVCVCVCVGVLGRGGEGSERMWEEM